VTNRDVLIVGVGASGANLDGIGQVLARVPTGSGMAYVVSLPLDADTARSTLDTLQRGSNLPMTLVEDRTPLEPDHVYVVSSDRPVEIDDGCVTPVLERSDARAQTLLASLVTVQEDERRRIARDLHDHVGQQLTALRLQLTALLNSNVDDDWREKVEHVEQMTARLDRDLSFLAWELRPSALDNVGLEAALERFVHEWSKTFDIMAEFLASGIDKRQLSHASRTALYRVVQEALHNVAKHAGASRVAVMLRRRGPHIVLVIEDNGVGFDVGGLADGASDSGLGLAAMRERTALIGGTFTIESTSGRGTTLIVEIPLAHCVEPGGPPEEAGHRRG